MAIGYEKKIRPEHKHPVETPPPVHSPGASGESGPVPKRQVRESRRTEIVRELIKKSRQKDKFEPDPILSDTIVKDQQMAGG